MNIRLSNQNILKYQSRPIMTFFFFYFCVNYPFKKVFSRMFVDQQPLLFLETSKHSPNPNLKMTGCEECYSRNKKGC